MKTTLANLEIDIKKLQLAPGDVAVITVPKQDARHLHMIGKKVAKLMRPHKVLVQAEGYRIDKLADRLTPEEVDRLSMQMEQRLLNTPAMQFPVQLFERKRRKAKKR